jgi:hypothetical protein
VSAHYPIEEVCRINNFNSVSATDGRHRDTKKVRNGEKTDRERKRDKYTERKREKETTKIDRKKGRQRHREEEGKRDNTHR